TLHRFSNKDEETFNELLILEESASEPKATVSQLIGQAKHILPQLNDPKTRFLLESYLFKIRLTKEGGENFLLLQELQEYPHILNLLLQEFLKAVIAYTRNLEKGILSDQIGFVISLSFR